MTSAWNVAEAVIAIGAVVVGSGLVGGCSDSGPSSQLREVVVYTSVDEVFARPIAERFERRTGVRVRLVADTEETKSKAPFIEVNCAAIPAELIESELFGHIRGSFTGAVADRAGKFEQAHEGTLFLDEIGDMSLAAQAKVLRALEEGVITRVGGSKAIQVDARVIAATNKDLPEEIAEGRFREDLFYRLNVVPIVVPPLRERPEDIRPLVAHFVGQAMGVTHVAPKILEEEALARLEALQWPGNVRELRNTVERLLILSPGEAVRAADVDSLVAGATGGDGFGVALLGVHTFGEFKEQAELVYITHKLRENNWNVSETARQIDMPRSNLYKKIEKYGLTRDD